ncbi:MAG: cyanophycin synthetase [Clostridia bacterium]|nr:cyanophycin synthetase [Clostridia bacterium]
MKVLEIKSYNNRNIYSYRPVTKMVIDLQKYKDLVTKNIKGFNKTILEYLPGLKDHRCSKGYAGGFVERLEEGTYIAHVIEHISIEIQNILGYDISFGKAREIGDGIYNIIFGHVSEIAARQSGMLAVDIVESIISNKTIELEKKLKLIQSKVKEYELGPSTAAIIGEATKRGIPVIRIGNDSLFQLGYGKYQKRIESTITDNTSCISVDISCDKYLSKELLSQNGIVVPEGQIVTDEDQAIDVANLIGYPVVVKPRTGNQGKGVRVDINTDQELIQAFRLVKRYDQDVLIEKFIDGKDYRILVVGNKVISVSNRVPAFVIGDGKSTIKQLVEQENKNNTRGEGHEKPLTKIKLDDISLDILKRQGLNTHSIPKKGQKIKLKDNANLSTGGIAYDCTDKIHPINSDIAERAAKIIGLDIAGIDLIAPDISRPITETGGAVIEVNACPGIRMHHYPNRGKSRNVARTILDMLFPYGSKHSIPIISITGTNGKTTIARMISHILRTSGLNVGLACTGGIYINEKCILKGDTTGPESARTVLMDRSIDMAVLETARGGILRAGLGYDISDIGVITNISNDHIGTDDIQTLEELIFIKSLVIESIKQNGYAILNADDNMALEMSRRTSADIIYFSLNNKNLILKKHAVNGGISVHIKDGYININKGENNIQVIEVKQIPATYNGKLQYNVQNSLVAVSACFGLGIPISIIEKGLKTFYTDEYQNPGRFNLYNIKDFRVVVDYAHNIDGYKQVGKALKKMGASRLIGIIGVPGDRPDNIVLEIGRVCGGIFDKIIIKEDIYKRGRKPGEIAKILETGIKYAGRQSRDINIILRETDALRYAVSNALPGDLIVVFFERLKPILDYIKTISNHTEETRLDYRQNS